MSVLSAEPATIDVSGTPRVPFARLVKVELRKLVDTRAGRWLLGITLGVLALVTGIVLLVAAFQDDFTMSLSDWQGMLSFLMSLLLPAIAITSITSEWGQRTSLFTFALEPHRLRVVAAKLVAVVLLAVATLVFAAVLAVVANVLMSVVTGQEAAWSVDGEDLAWNIYLQVAYFLMAFGLGMVFLNTAGAIVVYYVVALVLPQIVYGAVYVLVSWGPEVIPWLDLRFSVAQYLGQMPPPEAGGAPDFGIAPVVVTALLWIVVPFVIGVTRIRRVELK